MFRIIRNNIVITRMSAVTNTEMIIVKIMRITVKATIMSMGVITKDSQIKSSVRPESFDKLRRALSKGLQYQLIDID
jgi:hypothetical protein